MNKEAIYDIILFISLLVLQVVIFNHIVLFGVACPFIFIYFIIKMRVSLNTNLLLLFSFLLGFFIDICSDTLGVNSLSSTILAMLKRPLYFVYETRDDRTVNLIPGINTLGTWTFIKYLLSMCFIYCLIAFSVEYFSFSGLKDILIMILSSTLFTFLIIMGLDSLVSIKHENK